MRLHTHTTGARGVVPTEVVSQSTTRLSVDVSSVAYFYDEYHESVVLYICDYSIVSSAKLVCIYADPSGQIPEHQKPFTHYK